MTHMEDQDLNPLCPTCDTPVRRATRERLDKGASYQAMADIYNEAEENGESGLLAVVDAFGFEKGRASAYIHRARKRGMVKFRKGQGAQVGQRIA